jgi:hypothetical protein
VICWTESSCCYSTKITLLIEWSHRYTKIYGHHHEPVDRYEYLFLKWQWLFSPFSFLYHFSRTWQWVTWWVSYQTQAKYLPFTSTYLCSRFLAMSVMLILLFSVLRVLFCFDLFCIVLKEYQQLFAKQWYLLAKLSGEIFNIFWIITSDLMLCFDQQFR